MQYFFILLGIFLNNIKIDIIEEDYNEIISLRGKAIKEKQLKNIYVRLDSLSKT